MLKLVFCIQLLVREVSVIPLEILKEIYLLVVKSQQNTILHLVM